MKTKKMIIGIISLLTAFSIVGCSNSDSKSSSGSSSESRQELKVYIDDEEPYYINKENEVIRFDTELTDGGDVEQISETSEPVYGEYDNAGIKYTLSDGWYTDDSFGVQMMYPDASGTGNEYFVLSEASMMLEGDYDSINKEAVENYFKPYIESGQVESYEIEEMKDISKANQMNAKGFRLTINEVTNTDDEATEFGSETEPGTTTFYCEYIIIDAYTPYLLNVNATYDDSVIENVDKVRDEVLSTLEISEVSADESGELIEE